MTMVCRMGVCEGVALMPQTGSESPRSWLRLSGPVAGFLFVALLVVIASTTLNAPKPDESAGSTLTWYAGHRGIALAGVFMSSLAAGTFLWFTAQLRAHLARASMTGGLSGAVAISGTAVAVTAMTGTASTYALTMMANRPGVTPDAGVVRMLTDLGSVWFGFLSVFAGVFLLAMALAFFGRMVLPSWAGWVALVAGVLAIVAGSVGFFPDTQGKPMGATFLAVFGFVGFLLVVLAAGIAMLRAETSRVSGELPSAG